MSIAQGLIGLLQDEMERHGKKKLLRVTVTHGVLSGVVGESLSMAFEILTEGTALAGAQLTLIEEPLKLGCGSCGKSFMPGADTPGQPLRSAALISPCPFCHEEFGHTVLAGKELYLAQIEIE